MTLWLPRVFFEIASMTLLVVFLRISMIGFKVGEKPITGWRAVTIKSAYKLCSWSVQTACGGSYELIDDDFDYSEYLGKDYKKT